MTLSELLTSYIEQFGCSARAFADACGLSRSVISRYLSGERRPKAGGSSSSLRKLAHGISLLSGEHTDSPLSEEEAFHILEAALNDTEEQPPKAAAKKRIRTTEKSPFDGFLDALNAFPESALLINDVRLPKNSVRKIRFPISDENLAIEGVDVGASTTESGGFSAKVGSGDCVREVFGQSDVALPETPFKLPTGKRRRSMDDLHSAEHAFFRAAVLSESAGDVILYNDLPAAKKEEKKLRQYEMAMLIKKGLHLYLIRDMQMPQEQLSAWLEHFLPLCMGGRISLYHCRHAENAVFSHALYSAGTAALWGDAVTGCEENGRFLVTENKKDVSFARKRAGDLLRQAQPFLETYPAKSSDGLRHLSAAQDEKGAQTHHYKELSITICPGRQVLIARHNAPETRLVFRAPEIIQAF